MSKFEALLVSLLQQQQRTNDLMLKFMQKCDSETKPIIAKPVHVSVSDLPKFSETISSDEAFRYLGTSNLRDLNESDRFLVRAFKFISFRKRFSKLTGSLPESVQLQHLYCCLLGAPQDHAIIEKVSTAEELLDCLSKRYASASDLGTLEEIIREKLESAFSKFRCLVARGIEIWNERSNSMELEYN